MYYIISLKHTLKQDKYITLWRANDRGYCYAQDQAGLYFEIRDGYHNNIYDSIPIEQEKLDGFFINSDLSSDDVVKKCIPNCKQVWDILGFKMTKNGLMIS